MKLLRAACALVAAVVVCANNAARAEVMRIEVTNTFVETFWSKQGFNWFAGI